MRTRRWTVAAFAAAGVGLSALSGGTASGQTTAETGQTVIGKVTISGIGALDLRGVDVGVITGGGTGPHPLPGTLQPMTTIIDVDKSTPAILRLVLMGDVRQLKADLYSAGSADTVGTSVTAVGARAAKLTIHHGGQTGERLLATVEWDVSHAKVTMTSEGTSACWDVSNAQTC